LEELNKENKNLILDNIDIESFYEYFLNYENKVSFDLLKNINKEQINLETFDLYIENLEELKKVLNIKNISKKVFTKNVSNISNFLEYNNIE
jgi:Asp-tRNA(Asn)/Glu-tRNA(Gln) amidotransferase B subunit